MNRVIRFQCPVCEKKLRAKSRDAGRKLHCPRCGKTLEVPAPPTVFVREEVANLPSRVGDPTLSPPAAILPLEEERSFAKPIARPSPTPDRSPATERETDFTEPMDDEDEVEVDLPIPRPLALLPITTFAALHGFTWYGMLRWVIPMGAAYGWLSLGACLLAAFWRLRHHVRETPELVRHGLSTLVCSWLLFCPLAGLKGLGIMRGGGGLYGTLWLLQPLLRRDFSPAQSLCIASLYVAVGGALALVFVHWASPRASGFEKYRWLLHQAIPRRGPPRR